MYRRKQPTRVSPTNKMTQPTNYVHKRNSGLHDTSITDDSVHATTTTMTEREPVAKKMRSMFENNSLDS